jgi:alanyl-tRNA synthetase
MTKTKRLYYESHNLETQAKVMDLGHDDHGHYVILDQTVAHVKGGGAKADRGTIGTATFNEVLADGRDGDPRHYLDGAPTFAVGDVVEVKVDPEWRALQAAYHSAGHILAAVAEEQFPAIKAVAGHHYVGEARVEFTGEPVPADLNDLKTKLDAALKDAIMRDLPIQVLNPYQNRQVQVGSHPPVACGGVHCKTTGELGRVEIKSVKLKGRLRLSYEVLRG